MLVFRLFLLFGVSIGLTASLYSQGLSIGSIDKTVGYFGEVVTIRGNGFSSDPSRLVVKFGAQSARILSSTETLIEAFVPAGATVESLTVTNLSTGRTGYSGSRFTLSFGGGAFDPARFSNTLEESSGEEPYDVDLHDFDLDGKVDILITKISSVSRDIAIAQNTTTDPLNTSFTILNSATNPELSIGLPTQFSDVADLDGDGLNDIVLTVENGNSNQLFFLKNLSTPGNVKFGNSFSRFVGNEHRLGAVKIKDINDDGRPDVVAANTFANGEISVFLNTGANADMGVSTEETFLDMPTGTNSFDLFLEDLNGDSKPEIIVNQRVASNAYVLTNRSSGGNLQFDPPITINNAQGNLTLMEVADLDRDGLNDLVISRSVVQEDIIILTNTTGNGETISFSFPQQFQPEGRPIGIGLGDLDGNQTIDIVTSSSTNNIGAYSNETTTPGALSFSENLIATSAPSRIIKIADVNLDAKPDIIHSIVDPATGNFGIGILLNEHCLTPEIIAQEPLTICNSQTKTLSTIPAPNTEYVWEKDGVEIKRSNDSFVDISVAGTYTVTANVGGCSEASPPLVIENRTSDVPATPVISDQNAACEGADVTLSASVPSGAAYFWTGPGGFTSTAASPVLTGVDINDAGKYFLSVTLNDCLSEPDSTIIEIISPPTSEISASGPTTFCEGDNVTLSTSDLASYNYQWFNGSNAISGATNASYTATTQGDYSVRLSSAVATCEVNSETVTVTTITPPTADFVSPTSICSQVESQFNNSSTVDATQTVSYLWHFGDLNSSTDENPLHTYASAGTYTVELTVSYSGIGCSDIISKSVTVDESVAFTIEANGDLQFCEGGDVILSIPDNGYTSVSWSTGSTDQSIQVSTSGEYTAQAVNASGCVSTDMTTVTVFENPIITISPSNPEIQKGSDIELIATGAESYDWSPATGLSSSIIPNPIASPDTTITYTVQGTDLNGCVNSTQVTVTVVTNPGLDAPVAFTPNNDGINDLWVVSGLDTCPQCTMMIFNRQGNKVFEASPYLNNWDGTQNGSQLPEGAYYYVWSENGGLSFSGSVTVVR